MKAISKTGGRLFRNSPFKRKWMPQLWDELAMAMCGLGGSECPEARDR